MHGKESVFFSLNNRRLWVLKECREMGLLKDNVVLVRVKPAADSRRLLDKYTPERCVLHARFMGAANPRDVHENSGGKHVRARMSSS
jgi:hypothetical protein